MLLKTEKDGTTVYTIDRSSKAKILPPETVYSGKIKAIILPLSIRTPNHKKYKEREIHLCFSALKPNEDKTDAIKKELNFLYKYGTYAPETHLIPMSVREREPIDEMFKGAYLKYSMPCGPMPGTATISERVDFFPCHDDVLEMMIKHFDYPDFFVSLLPTSVMLNLKIKSSKKITYQKVPLKHTNGRCNDGVGYSYIHVYDDKGNRGVSRYKQLKWDTFEFEEDEFNSPWLNSDFSRYIDFK